MPPRRSHNPNQPTALYRFFDAKGDLLYVGITVNLRKRWRYHEKERSNSWWPLAKRRSVEWFPNRGDAARAEVRAIKTELPRFNVMHTERAHQPYGNRPGTVTHGNVSPTRGAMMLSVITESYPETAFTQMDILALTPLSRSAVCQNFRALRARGEIVAVGRRSDGRAGLGHVLYALSSSSLALCKEPIYELSEEGKQRQTERRARDRPLPSQRRSVESSRNWVYGSYPRPSAFGTLAKIYEVYGKTGTFTRQDLMRITGLSHPGLLKHVISLEKHGFLRCVGREAPVPGRSGHPPKLYALTDLRPPAAVTPAPDDR